MAFSFALEVRCGQRGHDSGSGELTTSVKQLGNGGWLRKLDRQRSALAGPRIAAIRDVE
jgi:hypothetical protein